ncbi:WYL domain-containing protein [Mesorhizobium sp. B1-1-1]|nr:WYL domain-containing protein [Mesorhizobium sp. B1-1-1]
MERTICDAIRSRSIISFNYKGKGRRVEPHTLGYDSKGHLALCGWQLSGGSGQDWRDFHLSGMSQLVITTEKFSGPRNGYKRDDKTMSRVLCQL